MGKLGLLILTLVSLSALSQKSVTGYYASKTAELGFFVTRIELNDDYTFKYEFGGDLLYDKGTGKYQLGEDKLVLLEFDEVKLDSVDQIARSLQGTRAANRPKKLLYKNGKLFGFHKEGHLVKKNYLIRRKYEKLTWRVEKQATNNR